MSSESLTLEFDQEIERDHDQITAKIVGFHADLIRVAPVDTGEFRGAWKMKTNSPWSWTIENRQDYALKLWYGHSPQWTGGDPMLEQFKKDLDDAI